MKDEIISKTSPLPKNKEHFLSLIPFAKNILAICKSVGISPVIYGSYAHFYYIKENMPVNDLDIWIPEKKYPSLINNLKKNKIKFKYYPKWHTLVIEKGKLKVEVDSIDFWYKDVNERKLPKIFQKIDFYGEKANIISLKNIEIFYQTALKNSTSTKNKVKSRIKSLEKFLGRRLFWH